MPRVKFLTNLTGQADRWFVVDAHFGLDLGLDLGTQVVGSSSKCDSGKRRMIST